jgi:hypothetical protein
MTMTASVAAAPTPASFQSKLSLCTSTTTGEEGLELGDPGPSAPRAHDAKIAVAINDITSHAGIHLVPFTGTRFRSAR